MSWEKEVAELNKRRELAQQQGGEASIAKHHSRGKLTIRERIHHLLDDGSFQEHGQAAGFAQTNDAGELEEFSPANYIIGMGMVNQRRIAVGGEDFTLKGGSPNGAGLRKSVYAEHMAVRYKIPLVRLLEGGGGSVAGGGGKPTGPVGDPVFSEPRFKIIAEAMGVIPVVSAALGPVAGFPAGRLVASHFSVMTRNTAQVLIAGPAVVERAVNQKLTKEELGGSHIHLRSGVVDNVAEDEDHAFQQIRQFLSYLPTNVWQRAPRISCTDPVDRQEQSLLSIVPRDRKQAFEMRRIIEAVVDINSWFEISPYYGLGQIVGLARLNGQSVGVIANDCQYYAGAMTAEGAQKVRRFIEMCDSFHLPIVNLVDEPGFMIGPEAEANGTIRYGMSALVAMVQAQVPNASVSIHKTFGVAGAVHFGDNAYHLAWPSSEAGALPVEGGVAVAFHRQIAAADDPDAMRKQLEDKLSKNRNPFIRGESFNVHDVIDPRETRTKLCQWVEWIQPQLDALTEPVSFGYRP